jgi:hypothetical protein
MSIDSHLRAVVYRKKIPGNDRAKLDAEILHRTSFEYGCMIPVTQFESEELENKDESDSTSTVPKIGKFIFEL